MAENLSELKNDEKDVEAGSVATCRICLQSRRDGAEDEDLISPCMCKGTQQFVHRSCLDRWRSVKEGSVFSHCTTCKAQFHLRVVKLERKIQDKAKSILLATRNVIIVLLGLHIFIGILGVISYLVDKRHPIPIYYGIGVFAFLLLLGLFIFIAVLFFAPDRPTVNNCCEGLVLLLFSICMVVCGILGIITVAAIIFQGIQQNQNHIPDKIELTKEYVVEDLHGSYSPAKLDPEHVERLKGLNLF